MQLSEHEVLRRQALEELINLGINPYPADLVEVNDNSVRIKTEFEKDAAQYEGKTISLAGRIMSRRDMGKAAFVVIQDSVGKIQLYIKRDDICPGDDKQLYDVLFKNY